MDVQVGDRPATAAELSEILAKKAPDVTLSIEDSTGKVHHIAQHKVEASGRINAEFVFQKTGACNVAARLTDPKGRQVWARVNWPEVRVVPSPLEVSLCRRTEDGNHAPVAYTGCPTWIPEMFCQPQGGLFYAVRLKTDQPTSFFIESVSARDEQADFDSKSNLHLLPADGLSGDVCTVTLGSMSSSDLSGLHAAFPARVALLPGVPSTICWGRLIVALSFLVLLPLAVIVGRRLRAARRLKLLGTYATVIGGPTYDSRPLVPQDRIWPPTELLVLRDGGTYQFSYPGQPRNGAQLIARIRQRPDESVLLRAVENLPNLPAHTTTVLEPGAADVELDECTILRVNVGEEGRG